MEIWVLLLIVFVAGAIGGVVNALMTDNGFLLPKTEISDNVQIVRPGFIGNIIVSGVAACISWGLYGPVATAFIAGGPPSTTGSEASAPGLTLAGFVGAVLVGVAGARWLTNEVDKKLLRAAASEAASSQHDAGLAQALSVAPPANALDLAKRAP